MDTTQAAVDLAAALDELRRNQGPDVVERIMRAVFTLATEAPPPAPTT